MRYRKSQTGGGILAMLLALPFALGTGTARAGTSPSDDASRSEKTGEVDSSKARSTEESAEADQSETADADDEATRTNEASSSGDEGDGGSSGEKEDDFSVELDGAYSIWGLHQANFFLGRDHPLNDADYVVQNFRLKLKAGRPAYGAVLRADFAQGWWGADNKPNVDRTAAEDEGGTVRQEDQYNPYAYFRKKGTHYDIHVDHAYLYFRVPGLPLRMRAGREHRSVGNKLVLDQDLDGVVLESSPTDSLHFRASWGKVSEGFGSYKSPSGKLMSDGGNFSDTNLYGLQVGYDTEVLGARLFGLHYRDNTNMKTTDESPNGWAYFPQGLGYFYSRFQPQVSEVTALGIALDGTLSVAEGLSYNAEFDYLFGSDDIENEGYAGNLLDKNNGTLRGYNAYLDVTQSFDIGIPLDAGLTLGMGSGDGDPTGGAGNINRIQTQGLFGLTNVWEDSVMPDMGGITPQGLGSPASRGYRELQNTTVGQVSVGVRPVDALKVETSYSYLRATEPIHGWNSKGPTNETSSDIGQEIDLNFKLNIYENLKAVTLGGVFLPGDGASLLINGTSEHTEPAWEVKQVLVYKFEAP
ncbi:MAG: hypothetical protein ABEL76_09735 [Bradymonadaceae bacterium]